jgi:hypothetical protein
MKSLLVFVFGFGFVFTIWIIGTAALYYCLVETNKLDEGTLPFLICMIITDKVYEIFNDVRKANEE